MKLIFLDMDGVMNSHQSTHMHWRLNGRKCVYLGFEHICPIAASNLDWLLEKSDAKIVISSTWRKFHEPDEWHEKMAGIRGHEIHKWLEDNGHLETPYVVFDDDRDMDKVEKNFIWIDGDLGLTWKHIFEVFVRWGISP